MPAIVFGILVFVQIYLFWQPTQQLLVGLGVNAGLAIGLSIGVFALIAGGIAYVVDREIT